MKKLALLAGSLTFAGVMLSARAYTGKALSNHAQVTMEQARAIALRAYPGKTADEELEQESGGSGLRDSFDILSGKVTQEVSVDAKTGQLLV